MLAARAYASSILLLALCGRSAGAEGLPNPLHWLSKDTPTPVPHVRHVAPKPAAAAPTPAPAAAMSFVAVARTAKDAVVNISTSQMLPGGTQPETGRGIEPLNEDDAFSRRLPSDTVPNGIAAHALGSGVIIDKDGSIVTAAHIVKYAGTVIVTLQDKRVFEAHVVGRDDPTDVALLKIQPAGDLIALPLGSADALQAGQWVVALGYPAGESETVTAGIVNSTEHLIGGGPADDVIATDASNERNAGGPLLDLHAQVVGINSTADNRDAAGSAAGIALSSNLVKAVVEQLKTHGKVSRGWLGVSIQNVSPELARPFGVQKADGALVANVTADSPAAHAGMLRGDVIVEFDGTHVDDAHRLLALGGATPIGKVVPVSVLRSGETKRLSLTVGEQPAARAASPAPAPPGDWGLYVSDITPDLMRRFELDGREGVVVVAVATARAAAQAGLQLGDVITEANRRPVHTVAEYQGAVDGASADTDLLLLVERRGRPFFVAVRHPG